MSDAWDAHWQDYANATTVNPAQQYRRRLIFQRLKLGPNDDANLLDIGSGQGDFALEANRRLPRAQILGLELSETGVRMSEVKAPKAKFLQTDLLAGGRPPSGYEHWATHAVCSEVLEHVDEPVRLLQNAHSYLAPGCRLIVTVPGGPMSEFDRHIGHRQHFTPDSLRSLLSSAGFSVEQAGGVGMPFFNLYRLTVILRGRKLVEEIAQGKAPALVARTVMRAFNGLFYCNLGVGGWQMVGVAHFRP